MLFTKGRQRILDLNGDPVINAKVNFFLSGTSTPSPVYEDADFDDELPQPVRTDPYGYLPPIYYPATLLKAIVTDANDASLPDGTVDPINSFLTQADISLIFYPIIPVEDSAGITSVGPYPVGNVFRYMTSAQVADVVQRSLSVDVTAALQTAISIGIALYFPEGSYLISDSLALTDEAGFHWQGAGRSTILVNKASANKPTIKLTDCVYYYIGGMSISGRAGFPNHAILQDATTDGRNGFFEFKDLCLQPNGYGIELRKINTGKISNVEYWPSGTPVGGPMTGSTADAGTRKFGIVCDDAVAGNYANDLTIENCDVINVDQTIAGYQNIKIASDVLGNVQGVKIWNCELEGVGNRCKFRNVYNLEMAGCYLDDAEVSFDNVRYSEFRNNYNPRTVTAENCVNLALCDFSQGDVGSTVAIDSTCSGTLVENADVYALTDTSTTTSYLNWSIQGTRQNDRIRNRWIASPTFAAGDYTATTGTWTVESGDIGNMRSLLHDKTLTVQFEINTTTTASSATALHFKIPGGYTSAAFSQWFTYSYSQDNGTTTLFGVGRIIASDTKITLYRDLASTAFANVTNLLKVLGSATFELA